MSVVQPSSGDVPIVPDGLYRAQIVNVKDITLDEPDQFGKTQKVEINLAFDVDGETETLDPRVNRAWSEKATLFQIAIATGLDVDPFAPFDTEDLKGRWVNILTEQEEGKWPRVKAWSKVNTKPSRPRVVQCAHEEAIYNAAGQLVCAKCGTELQEPEDVPFET